MQWLDAACIELSAVKLRAITPTTSRPGRPAHKSGPTSKQSKTSLMRQRLSGSNSKSQPDNRTTLQRIIQKPPTATHKHIKSDTETGRQTIAKPRTTRPARTLHKTTIQITARDILNRKPEIKRGQKASTPQTSSLETPHVVTTATTVTVADSSDHTTKSTGTQQGAPTRIPQTAHNDATERQHIVKSKNDQRQSNKQKGKTDQKGKGPARNKKACNRLNTTSGAQATLDSWLKPMQPQVQTDQTRWQQQPAWDTLNPNNAATAGPERKLKVLVWNVRSVNNKNMDIKPMLATESAPDIVVLVDHKMKSTKIAEQLLPNHDVKMTQLMPKGSTHAGVLIAVSKSISSMGQMSVIPLANDALKEHMLHVSLDLPSSKPLHILGVYCSGGEKVRHAIYNEVQAAMTQHPYPNHVLMLAGDFNATIQDTDRHNRISYTRDRLHRAFLEKTKLQTVDPARNAEARLYTYLKGMECQENSRIDDIYLNLPTKEMTHTHAQTTIVDAVGTDFDHNGLVTTLRYSVLGLIPPPPPFTARVLNNTRIKNITAAQKEAASHALVETSTEKWQKLRARTDVIMEQEVYPHWRLLENQTADRPRPMHSLQGTAARQIIEQMGQEILQNLREDMEIVESIWPRHKTGTHHGRHMCNRGPAKRRKRLLEQRKAIGMLLHQLRHGSAHSKDVQSPPEAAMQAVQDKLAEYQAQQLTVSADPTMLAQPCPNELQEAALKHIRSEINKEKFEIEREHPRWCRQKDKSRQRSLMATNQKLASKQATGRHKPTPKIALRVLKAAHNTITTDGKEILGIVEAYEQQARAAPEPNGKSGKYLPEDVTRDYPFDNCRMYCNRDDYKQYEGLLQRTAPTKPRTWLHSCIDDAINFNDCIRSLKHGKTPGPDGVVNELLQVLPQAGKSAIHNVMKLMWATGLTPETWKESSTLLLFKNKGTPLELKYYRRIGLELTTYKLWTKLVTYSMVHYAETQKMLSGSQAGFRNKRTTTEQIEMMVSVLEDAYLTKQDIYLLQADLTEAFDTISHDKLLMILYDLGFPTDAIEVVKDLYRGARTSIQTPHGQTNDIVIDRGTLQGDSLSPFLFVLYIEPLLRWLKAGQKGYKVGALAPYGSDTQNLHRISDITFADGINLLTNSRPDMMHQAEKVTR